MTPTNNTTPVEECRKEIVAILEAPARSRFSTSDIRIGHMSSTHLKQVVDDISSLITLREERAREETYKAIEAEMLDKIYYIGTELPQVEQDKRDKFVVLGYPAQFLRNARSRSSGNK